MNGTDNILNAEVSHKKFGNGKIVGVDETHVTVSFDSLSESKVFAYPKAFEKFLAAIDEEIQGQIDSDVKECLLLATLEENKKIQKYHRLEVENKKERIAQYKKKKKAQEARLKREKKERERYAKAVV